ncbi:HPr kinase/phosphorylase [Alkalilacustris brevis]|uniref:HPr kinase/phosphorylase n=1 Tax=Alkalilacustris brevis TaxID=2026338 RepID=UPI000E0D8FEB|nr:HPr kinase/phosphatase C-terminal domain-containing protein [Alkalilacustris brevis]
MQIHASTVAIASPEDSARAVLILGPSGSGKSGLALELMARGALLVADDQTVLRREGTHLVASAPSAIRGLIEARGVGLLAADTLAAAPVSLVVDLSQRETRRLPPPQSREILGCALPLLHAVESAHFPAAILQYLQKGRSDRP